jgi:hypothetical protein
MGTTAGTGGEEGRRKGRRRRRVNLDGCRLLASSSRLLSLLSPGRDAAGDDEAVLGNRQRSEAALRCTMASIHGAAAATCRSVEGAESLMRSERSEDREEVAPLSVHSLRGGGRRTALVAGQEELGDDVQERGDVRAEQERGAGDVSQCARG